MGLVNKMRNQCGNYILISIILIIFGLSIGFRAYNRELLSDDLLYKYILDDKILGQNDLSDEVSSWHDAIESQKIQYFHSNGRFIVHIFVQMFAGVWGIGAFSIFLGVIGILIILLFNRYTFTRSTKYNPFLWILSIIAFLYLFQSNSGIWYSMAGGMNYLYPIFPVLVVLMCLKHFINYSGTSKWYILLGLVIIGLIAGASQECYSVPIAGATFILSLKYYHRLNVPIIVLLLSLWIGAATLIFAPGNFSRFEQSRGLLLMIINGFELLYGTVLFWIMLISIIILRLSHKDKFKKFNRENRLEVLMVIISITFGLVANSLSQSFNGVSFYCAIILFKIISSIPWGKKQYVYQILTIALLIPLSIHQYRIIKYCAVTKSIYHQFINDYKKSADGVMSPVKIDLPVDVKCFVRDIFKSKTVNWVMHSISKVYSKGTKPITLLKERDYFAFTNSQAFVKSNVKIINNRFYIGEDYFWMNKTDIDKRDSLLIEYIPIIQGENLIEKVVRLKRKLKKEDIKTSNIVISIDSVLESNSGLIGIPMKNYDIKNISIVKH